MTDFTYIQSFNIQKQLSDEQKAFLEQIGIKHTLTMQQYSFSAKFDPTDSTKFMNDLFSCEEVQGTFLLPDIAGQHNRFFKGKQQAEFSELSVNAAHVKALMPAISERYMNTETWKGMAPDKISDLDIEVSYLIDSALFDANTEDYKTFPDAWRQQLLSQIFMMLRAGGTLNQQSDMAADYVELAILIYKSMVKPCRLEAEEQPTLRHMAAYSVSKLSNFELFPENPDYLLHPGNKMIVVIDSLRRYVTLLYNAVWN